MGVRTLDGRADYLLFCDADDEVDRAWLSKLASPLRDGSADLVGGALMVRRKAERAAIVVPGVDYSYRQSVVSANMGMAFAAWTALGGFDEHLLASEDTDIAWRAASLGFRVVIVPSALIRYNLRSDLPSEFKQRFAWGRSAVQLIRKYSLARERLPGIRTIYSDKKSTGFANNVATAAFAEWLGQQFETVRFW